MKFVTDLHLHSKYSRAVSQNMTLPNLALWAKYKGITVVATGDFTHPFWLEQLKNELEEAGNGLYKLRKTTNDERLTPSQTRLTQDKKALDVSQLALSEQEVYFLLSCEISSIYSQGGKTRRIHNLFFFPTLVSVEKFNKALLTRGANLRSDGRPIVGIAARDLAEIALSCDGRALVIPAHVWTPWFSVFGSFSGFDSIEECFDNMSQYIYAIETGLSSDPAMNWQIGDLDGRTILSFSDAHSLEKMGREATVFEGEEISYNCIYDAIKGTKVTKEPKEPNEKITSGSSGSSVTSVTFPRIAFTIEFYPEEGKYHFTGHRDCNYSQGPEKYDAGGNICPKCGRPLTVGVMDRVEQLKTRNQKPETRDQDGVRWVYPASNDRPAYVSSVPLTEILAESLGTAVGGKKVLDQYLALVANFDNEINVLLKADLVQIEKIVGNRIADGIGRVRTGEIVVEPGYDGKYGVVKIWSGSEDEEKEEEAKEAQLNLFA